MRVWELISETAQNQLVQYQLDVHHARLAVIDEYRQPDIDVIPENDNLGKFMAEKPHSPVRVQ